MIAVEVDYTQELFKQADKMRDNPTVHEKRMRDRLQRFHIPFLEQQVIGWYIVDFLLLGRMLIIEIDGCQHHTSAGKMADDKRSQWLKSLGFIVARIPNRAVARFTARSIRSFPLVGKHRWEEAIAKADLYRGNNIVTVEIAEQWERPAIKTKKPKPRFVETIAQRSLPTHPDPYIDDLDTILDTLIDRELLKL